MGGRKVVAKSQRLKEKKINSFSTAKNAEDAKAKKSKDFNIEDIEFTEKSYNVQTQKTKSKDSVLS